jgi:hypothetical protein
MKTPPQPVSQEAAEVRRQVARVLGETPAYAALDEPRREALREAAERLVLEASAGRAGVADFPVFVAGLIDGTFQAIVDASIQQMEAYADLLEQATKSLTRFAAAARDDSTAQARQQLLATMVLMGVNRLVVEDGRIRAERVLDDDE